MSSQPSSNTDADNSSELTFNIYGYDPSLVAAIVFLVAFSLLTFLHLRLVVRSRIWWLSILAVGGLAEIIGWAGRLWSAENVYNLNAFLTQQVCLVLAPCFFSAACYGALGMIIRYLGAQHSRIRPSLYLVIFCLCDLVAIVVQAIGGAMAAIALEDDEDSDTGTHIMVVGIVFQLVSMIIFSCFGIDFYLRFKKSGDAMPKGRVPLLLYGITWSSFWILIRCVYRTVELAQGWTGYLITHQPYFLCLDSVPMVFVCAVFLYAHPYFCFDGKHNFLNSNKGLMAGGLRSNASSAAASVIVKEEAKESV